MFGYRIFHFHLFGIVFLGELIEELDEAYGSILKTKASNSWAVQGVTFP